MVLPRHHPALIHTPSGHLSETITDSPAAETILLLSAKRYCLSSDDCYNGVMSQSERVTIRLSPELAHAAEKAARAKGLSVGEWLRKLAEEATGVQADMKQGFAAMPKTQRQRASKKGLAVRWEKTE